MKFKLKLYFSLALTFFILINFGQINVLANDLSFSSGSKAKADTIIVTSPGEDATLVLNEFFLRQIYPNPFNPNTTIQYELTLYTNVQLKIYDIPGKELRELVNEYQQPGKKMYQRSGKDYSCKVDSSGVNVYQLQTREFLQKKFMPIILWH
jgi:hypothetical protein